jgi:hypothetical protein
MPIDGVSSGLTSTKTLNADDVIDGGNGTDTLDFEMTSSFTGFSTDGSMEVLDVENTSSLSRSFDATGVTGLETIKVNMNDQDFTVSDLAAADLAVEVTGADAGVELDVAYGTDVTDGTADSLTATLNDVGTAANTTTGAAQKTFELTSDGIEELTVVAAGTANYADLSGKVQGDR